MIKSELIDRLRETFPNLAVADVRIAINYILEAMAGALVKGHRIEIRGFGSFFVTYRSPRMARNPKTGVPVSVPRKTVPNFKAGKSLRESVL